MRRREFITVFGSAAAWPIVVQSADKPRRVGILSSSTSSDPAVRRVMQLFANRLREHGWEEGRNLVLEERFAGPDPARFPELAAELVGLGVDLIVGSNTQSVAAARSKTATIPIIMAGIADPVGSGLIASLSRPGGNITGVANQIDTVSANSIELLRESRPGIKRIGVIFSPNNAPSVRTFTAMRDEVAPRLGLIVLPVGIGKPEDFAEAFANITREQMEALLVLPTPLVFTHRAKVAEFAIAERLPTTAPAEHLVRAGLLMSYGYDWEATWTRAASYADRILKGASPSDLPVEQVDRFQLILNQKTARAIGFDATLLMSRADEVIE